MSLANDDSCPSVEAKLPEFSVICGGCTTLPDLGPLRPLEECAWVEKSKIPFRGFEELILRQYSIDPDFPVDISAGCDKGSKFCKLISLDTDKELTLTSKSRVVWSMLRRRNGKVSRLVLKVGKGEEVDKHPIPYTSLDVRLSSGYRCSKTS